MKETELGTEKVKEALKHISLPEISEELSIGELTLKDIIEALVRPERDPRDELPKTFAPSGYFEARGSSKRYSA